MTKTPDHITRELLRAVRRGELSYRRLAEILLAHLEQVCPPCRQESEAERAEEVALSAYREPVRRVRRSERLERELEAMREEARSAPLLFETLQDLSLEQRRLRLRNSPERYANRVLADLVLDAARACLPDDPAGSRAWAETAEAIAALYPEPYPPHVIRAVALQGNAFRAAGDFDSALVLLHRARSLMGEHEVTDLELGAELHSFLGSLFTDLRRFERAAEHLESAANLYRILESDEDLARVLLQLGILHRHLGDLEAALEADWAAVGLLSPELSPQLYVAARLNYTSHLAEAGEYEAARDMLVYDEDLYEEHADPHTRVRVTWLLGRIAAATVDPGEAERLFLVVLEEFARQAQGFDAAIACLDLAALYLREGRHTDLLETATQAVELFQAHEIHREALAALMLLRDAAVDQTLTAETIRRVTTFLREVQGDRTGRSEAPN